jgi:hypothetical protein
MDQFRFERWLRALSQPRLGCLERWGVVALAAGKRAGFGSGRGIRADWPVRLTASGEAAVRIWPGLIPEIDARWSKRFGDGATRLRRSFTQQGSRRRIPWPALSAS